MATDCAGLLADLAQEYEKSRVLLEEIEESLKQRPTFAALDELREADALPDSDGKATDGTNLEELELSAKNAKSWSHKNHGLKERIASLFTRKSRSMAPARRSETAGEDEQEEPVRRISVVNLNSPFPPATDERRRSIGVYSSNGALQPTSALQRMGQRGPMDHRRSQQQHELAECLEPMRMPSNSFSPSAAPLRRKSVEFASSGPRSSLDVPALANANVNRTSSRMLLSASTDINAQSRAGPCPNQLATSSSAAAPRQAADFGREDSFRRAPLSRRGSDHHIQLGPCHGTSFTASQLCWEHPGSPACSSPGCPSPTASLTSALPSLGPATSTKSLLRGQSSTGLAGNIRANSSTALSHALSPGQAELGPHRSVGSAFARDRGTVSATGMINTATATAMGMMESAGVTAGVATAPAAEGAAARPCSGTGQHLQLPQLTPRVSSGRPLHANSALAAGGGSGSGIWSPTTEAAAAAAQRDPRRLQPCRFASALGDCGTPVEDTAGGGCACGGCCGGGCGRRVGFSEQWGAVLDRQAEAPVYRGTMHII